MTIEDTLTDKQAIEIARAAIKEKPESYVQLDDLKHFEPHPWVILAVQMAFHKGFYHSI